MKIVPNSDILFTQKLITNRLPGHLEKLASECGRMGVRIVLPRTVLLEVERRQTQLMEGEITSLERAFATLRNAGVGFENKQASELFALPDLTQLFRTAGAEVSIEQPGVDDFNESHRR